MQAFLEISQSWEMKQGMEDVSLYCCFLCLSLAPSFKKAKLNKQTYKSEFGNKQVFPAKQILPIVYSYNFCDDSGIESEVMELCRKN